MIKLMLFADTPYQRGYITPKIDILFLSVYGESFYIISEDDKIDNILKLIIHTENNESKKYIASCIIDGYTLASINHIKILLYNNNEFSNLIKLYTFYDIFQEKEYAIKLNNNIELKGDLNFNKERQYIESKENNDLKSIFSNIVPDDVPNKIPYIMFIKNELVNELELISDEFEKKLLYSRNGEIAELIADKYPLIHKFSEMNAIVKTDILY